MDSSSPQGYLSPEQHILALAKAPDYKGAAKRAWISAASDQNSTLDHFLLELVQNADDNQYAAVDPTLTLTFTAGQHLKTHCNEEGFTPEDVTAIVSLYRSTKTTSHDKTGEKGIGFKSVLGVAGTAWIASREYRFKLHANAKETMKPELFNFPFPDGSYAEAQGTSMYFELTAHSTQPVRDAISRFDPSIMLFLKKLKKLILIIDGFDGRSETHLVRKEEALDVGGSHISIVRNGTAVLHYRHFSFPFTSTVRRKESQENRRSDIKLALPVSCDFQHVSPRNEKVYAWLPINDYGFKFAMHADFLLANSREQIHGNSEWNKRIREAISENFADAIRQLNGGDSNLCYTWPRLLVDSSENDDFFRNLMPEVVKKLKTLPVLKSENGGLVTPSGNLCYFPDKWRLEPDKRIPIQESNIRTYLSSKYDVECTNIIAQFGVNQISAHAFRDDLVSFSTEFAQQGPSWHSGVAEMINSDFRLDYLCRAVNIIPVTSREDGKTSWVSQSSEAGNLFITLGYDGGIGALPQGVGMLFIPHDTIENQHRRKLYEAYGAKYVSAEIGNIALRVQTAHSEFDPEKSDAWTTDDLVSHIRFFFRHQEVLAPSRIWVAVESGPPQLASETFPTPIAFNQLPLQVPVLHPAYLADLSEEDAEKMVAWMTKTFGMPARPRLAISKGNALVLSPEMKFIANEYDSIHFLSLLRHHYQFYTTQLEKGRGGFQQILWEEIASTTIRYLDPSDTHRQRLLPVPLRDTVIPSRDTKLLQAQVPLPLLPVRTFDERNWYFLETFGVKREPHFKHWLACLRKIKSDMTGVSPPTQGDAGGTSPGISTIAVIYSSLDGAYTSAKDKPSILSGIREAFDDEALLFIPPILTQESEHTWAHPSQCIWRSPRDLTLRHTFSLEKVEEYYALQYFLWDVLKVDKELDLFHLRRDAEHLSTSPDLNTPKTLSYIARLFKKMDREIKRLRQHDPGTGQMFDALSQCAMIPICLPNSANVVDKLVAAADSNEEWYMADRKIFFESFEHRAPLLALDPDQIEDCQTLLSFLRLDHRRLSRNAVAVPTTETELEETATKKWDTWAKYIDRLAYPPRYTELPALPHLEGSQLRVFSLNTLSVIWEVEGLRDRYHGEIRGRVALASLSGKDFTIYVQKGRFPSDLALTELADDICDIYHVMAGRQLLLRLIIGIDESGEVERILELRRIADRPKEIAIDQSLAKPKRRDRRLEPTAARGIKGEQGATGAKAASQRKSSAQHITRQDSRLESAGQTVVSRTKRKGTSSKQEDPARVSPSTTSEAATKVAIRERKPTDRKPQAHTDVEPESKQVKTGDHAGLQNSNGANATKASPDSRAPDDVDEGSRRFPGQSQDDSGVSDSQNRGRTNLAAPSRDNRASSVGHDSGKNMRKPPGTPRWDLVPPGEQGAIEPSRPAAVPEPEVGFTNMALGTAYYLPLRVSFEDNDTEDSAYYAQLYVSRFLSSFLKSYDVGVHWTSTLRTRHGLGPLPPGISSDAAAFTIPETDGPLRDFVIQGCRIDESWINKSCTFHIEVCATVGGLHSPFYLSKEQCAKAETMRLDEGCGAKDVCILARVYDVRTEPAIALFVDPWRLKEGGHIKFEQAFSQKVKVLSATSALLTERCTNLGPSPTESGEMYKDIEINEQHIRLLELDLSHENSDGGSGDGSEGENTPLRVKLRRVSINRPGRFWAISYVWGDKPAKYAPRLEVINEVNDSRVMVPITDSLWSCLQTLRRKRIAVPLWADAICINQEDSVEKAFQVRRMGGLYGKAERVLIWTGNEQGKDSGAIEWLETLARYPENPSPALVEKMEGSLVEGGRLVDAFMRRSWFGRTWTIQELVFGRQVTVMSGESEIEWDVFMDCVIKYETLMQQAYGRTGNQRQQRFLEYSDPVFSLHQTRQYYRKTSEQDSNRELRYRFLTLVELFYYTRSSIPRDKMFALLNLAYDIPPNEPAFWPDYRSDESFILANYARGLVKEGQVLDLMYRAGVGKGTSFCSWIPDLMNERGEDHYAPSISSWETASPPWTDEPGFCAGEWFRAEASVVSPHSGWSTSANGMRPLVLSITGKMFDSVKTCDSLKLKLGGRSIPFSQTLAIFRRSVAPLLIYPNLGRDWVDELTVKCLTGNAAGPQSAAPPLPSAMGRSQRRPTPKTRWLQGFERYVLDVHPGQDGSEFENRPAEARDAIVQFWTTVSAFMQRIPGAAVCTTGKGYAGIFPGQVEPDDKIFLPRGSKVPFVLRRFNDIESQEKHYRLIGECYVHGIMYHEDTSVKKLGDEVAYIV